MENKDTTKNVKKENGRINPSDIEGKIEVSDTRERRDGPGGN